MCGHKDTAYLDNIAAQKDEGLALTSWQLRGQTQMIRLSRGRIQPFVRTRMGSQLGAAAEIWLRSPSAS